MINEHRLEVTVLSAGPKLSQTGQEPPYCWAPACVGGVCWNGVIARIVMLSAFMKDAAEDHSALPEVFFRQWGQKRMKRSGYRFDSEALKVGSGWSSDCEDMYSCAVSLGGLSACRPSSWWPKSKHHGLTFLSSVSTERDKSGLPAALAASRYLVTFQTVGVGGLSQARPGWEGNRGQVIPLLSGGTSPAYGFNISLPRVMSHPHPQTHTWLMQNDRPTAGGFGPTVFSSLCVVSVRWVFFSFGSDGWCLTLSYTLFPLCPLPERLDCFQEACKRTAETFILTHFHGKGKVTWLQKCPGIRLGGLWPWGVSPKRMSLLRRRKILGLCVTLCGFLLVATDKHVQKKAHGHQHGQACPSSSPCNVRADFVQEEALRKQGEIVSGGAFVPHYKRTWKWILWKPVSASKKKKKKSELWESSK